MKIVFYPHPSLRHVAVPLTSIDKKVHLQVGEMFDLMYEAKGLGLAAPQVALPFRLLIMNLSGDPNQKDQQHEFINPEIVQRQGSVEGEEGCLSLPGLYKKIRRARTIKVRAYNLKGAAVEIEASDMAARVWQHEVDHLNGVLFIDKIGSIAKIGARGQIHEFERDYRRSQEKGDIPPDPEIEKMLKSLEAEA